MNASTRQQAAPGFRHLLRHWRSVRRLSQLALATEAQISARHLCFLETGRGLPSREMVQLLGSALDIPFADQNAMLMAAGYAPLYGERDLDSPELQHVRRALEFILAQQEPFPAIVIDGHWNVRMRNAASHHIFGAFRAFYELSGEHADNAMHVVCHPRGLRPFIRNWEQFAGSLLQVLHREALQGTNAAAAGLLAELLRYPGMPKDWHAPDAVGGEAPLLTMRLRRGDSDLAFFTTLTTFAMPRDVTLQQLKIECFFPADAATAEAVRQLAANR